MTDTSRITLREVALEASRRVGGLQGRALDREAKRRGLTLSYTTVDKIIAGTYTSRPKTATLEALAALSGIPLTRVYDAAGLPMPLAPLADVLPPDADLLSPEQRRVVLDVVRQFAKQNRELAELRRAEERDGDGNAATNTEAGPEGPAVRNRMVTRQEPHVSLEDGQPQPTGTSRGRKGHLPRQG
jgi:hypothetical protein